MAETAEAPPAADKTAAPPTPAPPAPAAPPTEERSVEGFPKGKSLVEISDAERATYWQNHARKHKNASKRSKG